MKKYTFTCTCGDKVSVEAMDGDEAKKKLMEMMPEDAMKAHFAEKHTGESVPEYQAFMDAATMVEEPAAAPAM